MSIYWVRFQGDSAAEAMKAIAEALRHDEHGAAPEQAAVPAATTPSPLPLEGDDYLQTNLEAMRRLWSIDPLRAELPADHRILSRLRVHLQHTIRRVTRWYFLLPWLQANEFHGAVTRVVESLLARQHALQRELDECRYRLQAAEQQVQLLRNELAISRQHLMEMRQQMAMYQNTSE